MTTLMAEGLKRLPGKKNAYRLQKDVHAWNIDGSSADKPIDTSWIKYWESCSGLGRRRCAFLGCDRDAEHGGHVWIMGHSSRKRGVWIVPLCRKCNYCDNAHRQMDANGDHSFLRQGTVVVRTEYTEDMAHAPRRVSSFDTDEGYDSQEYEVDDWEVRICEDCMIDLPFGAPKHHRKCIDCVERGGPPPGRCSYRVNGMQVTEAEFKAYKEERRREEARWASCIQMDLDREASHLGSYDLVGTFEGRTSALARGRRCEGCGQDISERPDKHKVCPGCYYGRSHGGVAQTKRARGRRCEGCGQDISERPDKHKVCPGCYYGRSHGGVAQTKRARGRRCEGCGQDISEKPDNHKVCLDCYRMRVY